MRLGVLTTSYPRTPGDPAGRFVHGFVEAVAARAHDVDVLAIGPRTAAGEPSRSGRVRVRWISGGQRLFTDGGGAPERLAVGGRAWMAAAAAQAALASAVRAEARRWDAVVSHWLVPSGLAAALAAGGRPHLAIAHSSDVHLAVRLRLARPLARLLCAPRATRFAFTSRALLDELAGAAGAAGREVRRRAIVQPMGVEDDLRPATGAERSAARAQLGLDADRLVVLCVARLVPVKGVDVLLEAARIAGERGVRPALLVAGDGPERRSLVALADRLRVDARFLGEVRGARRAAAFAASDAQCLPSRVLADGRTEGAPVAALEGFAAGLPVAASAVGGLPELLEDGKHGLLVRPDDSQGLAAALVRLADPDTRAAFSRRSAAAAKAHTWSATAGRLLAHLQSRPPGRPSGQACSVQFPAAWTGGHPRGSLDER